MRKMTRLIAFSAVTLAVIAMTADTGHACGRGWGGGWGGHHCGYGGGGWGGCHTGWGWGGGCHTGYASYGGGYYSGFSGHGGCIGGACGTGYHTGYGGSYYDATPHSSTNAYEVRNVRPAPANRIVRTVSTQPAATVPVSFVAPAQPAAPATPAKEWDLRLFY